MAITTTELYLFGRRGQRNDGWRYLRYYDGRKGWINRLIITSAYRKKGIAKRLIEDFEQRLTSIGINIVACLIEDWNTASMQVFKQLGYTKHTDILYFSKRKNMKT